MMIKGIIASIRKKPCKHCGGVKKLKEFPHLCNGGYNSWCKQCLSENSKERAKAKREESLNDASVEIPQTDYFFVFEKALLEQPECAAPTKVFAKVFVSWPMINGQTFEATEELVQEYEQRYKDSRISVREEFQKMADWNHKNTYKRKRYRGMRAFITKWLNRAVSAANGNNPFPPKPKRATAAQKKKKDNKTRRIPKDGHRLPVSEQLQKFQEAEERFGKLLSEKMKKFILDYETYETALDVYKQHYVGTTWGDVQKTIQNSSELKQYLGHMGKWDDPVRKIDEHIFGRDISGLENKYEQPYDIAV